jgi:transposase
MHRIGEETSEALDLVPAWLRVLRTIRPKYACRTCEGPIVQAKAPARLVEGGMATTALIAHIATAKYAWQSTLYRQAQILAGHGVVVDRQTLARWMGSAAWMAKGLYDLQLRTMHRFERLFCDETPMPVLDPGHGRTKLPVLGACDGRPGLEGSGAAGGRLRVRGRPRQKGDRGATGGLRRRAAGRRLRRLRLAGGRCEDVGQDPAGVLPRSRAPQLREGAQDDELALR